MKIVFYLSIALLLYSCTNIDSKDMNKNKIPYNATKLDTATFAGGCFWCMDAPFEQLEGVENVVVGYGGGHVKDPTYQEVETGTTGNVESVDVIYDPKVISYSEILTVYWKQFDPTDTGGSFYDRGSQYKAVIFYHNQMQKEAAEKSKNLLNLSGIFHKPIATKIKRFTSFYPAEKYHQHFFRKNPVHYEEYRKASGRDSFIEGVWGDMGIDRYKKPSDKILRKELTPIQYRVTQEGATEPPFNNKYWNNHKEGIYVDIVSGEPLFCSTDKFNSGTGWPSFTRPIDPRYLVKKVDDSMGMERIEVSSKFGDSHLGHVFDDGPAPTHLRYCIDSAALRFIPKKNMTKDGYGEFLYLFK